MTTFPRGQRRRYALESARLPGPAHAPKRAELAELRGADLRLTADDAAAFLSDVVSTWRAHKIYTNSGTQTSGHRCPGSDPQRLQRLGAGECRLWTSRAPAVSCRA